jgi:hypothetical protein
MLPNVARMLMRSDQELKLLKMKNLFKYLLVFSFLFSLNCVAQEPGDSKPLASKSTMKGRKELRKERKVKKHSDGNAKKQERSAIKRSKVKHYTVGKSKKMRPRKSKNKEKKTDEPKEKS